MFTEKINKIRCLWTHLEVRHGRERLLLGLGVLGVIALTLWIAQVSPTESRPEGTEMGLTIPKGQLIVPLELANATALGGLISHSAIVNLFKAGEKEPLAEALRIIKLSAGEGPLFGALVPENLGGRLQELFANPKLRGALCPEQSGPTRFHLRNTLKPSFIEIHVGE